MTAALAVLGVLCLVGFCVIWWPGSLFTAGLLLLWLSAVRSANEKRRVGAGR